VVGVSDYWSWGLGFDSRFCRWGEEKTQL
jgi:hypothetical protein